MPSISGRSFFETAALLSVRHEKLSHATLIAQPSRIPAAGNKPKLSDEYVGRVNSSTSGVSVAHMRSPQGWMEPGQTPEVDEFTIVPKGMVRVTHKAGKWMFAAVRRS